MKLGDVLSVKHGYAFKSQFFSEAGPYVLLTPGSFYEEGGFRDQADKTKYYTGDFDGQWILGKGDLIVAMTEQAEGLLGSSALIPEPNKYLHNQRLGLITGIDDSQADRNYLYYLFNTREVRAQISASASGTKVRHTSPSRICQVDVDLPPVSIQRRIADILSAYDDLIENNRRRMTLLEEAARMIYREWFVRLRFPGYETARIVDGVPEGWRECTLADVCSEVRESVSPSDVDSETPYIGLEHMPRRSITLSSWGRAGDVSSSKHRYQMDDILFGKIRPYFHKVGVAFTDGVASSDAIVIRASEERYHSVVLLTVSSDEFVAVTSQTMREGSKMPRADWKIMRASSMLLPPNALLDDFNDIASSIVRQLRTLSFQNQKLQQARDILLPKLMSGEIDVSETADTADTELACV